MKFIVKLLMLLVLGYNPAYANVQPHESCVDAPERAVVTFSEPFAKWVDIKCKVGKGHWLIAGQNYVWQVKKQVKGTKTAFNVVFSSIGRRAYKGQDKHKGYFNKKKEDNKNMSELVYRLWPKGTPRTKTNGKYKEVRHLQLASNANEFYSVFFFVQNGEPEWLLSCHDRSSEQFCQKAVLLKVLRAEDGYKKPKLALIAD